MKGWRLRFWLGFLALGLMMAPALAVVYARWLEPSWLQVRRAALPIAELPPQLEGLTMVQLSDLHRGPQVSAAQIRRVVDRAARLDADLIVLTGDFVTGDATLAYAVAQELARLYAPLGVYAVLGNHDVWTDADTVAAALEGVGIRVLRNEAVTLETLPVPLTLVGLEDTGDVRLEPCLSPFSSWEKTLARLPALTADTPHPRLLLLHNPDLAHWLPAGEVDAVLSGHTHGGQVRLPLLGGPPVVPSCHGARYAAGLVFTPQGTPVYVSRGTGTAVLPLRWGVRPEITLLHLTREVKP